MALSKAEIERIASETGTAVLQWAGAGVPETRIIRKTLSDRLKVESGGDVAAIGLAIASDPRMKSARARWVGWELIQKHKGASATLDLASVTALGEGNSTWDEVDGFGLCIFGPAWLRGQIGDHEVMAWAADPDLWKRRTALVGTVALNTKAHGGSGDARRTLEVAGVLVDDREDMVVKAMSWALRALASWDRDAVVAFMARHDDHLAARVKREVRTKLRTGKKNAKAPVSGE